MTKTKTMTRRSLLTTVAVGGGAVALAGCSAGQIATAETALTSFYNDVQAGVVAIQKYVPTIESIAETAAGLFGPAWSTTVTFGVNLVNQVIASIESALNNVPPATASAKLERMGATPGLLVTIGGVPGLINPKTGQQVVITGYK
jgi:hypothetical protein